MRSLLTVATVALALISGCSSSDDDDASGVDESPSVSASTTEPVESQNPDESSGTASQSSCDLLSDADVERFLGVTGITGTPGGIGIVPGCQWVSDDGKYMQVIAVDASDWAKQLPDTLEQAKASGLFRDAANLRKLRQGAALVADGKDLDPDQACAMFSMLLEELQGQPEGSTMIVNVIPTPAEPNAVAGQTCTEGRFTSVMVADPKGLTEPLPTSAIESLTKSVHEKVVN